MASEDNVGIDHYNVYCNNVKVKETAQTEYTDTGMQPGQLYSYTIEAVYVDENVSAKSEPLNVNKGTSSLTVGEITTNSITLYITNPSGKTLKVWENDTPYTTKSLGAGDTTYLLQGLASGKNYSFQILSSSGTTEDNAEAQTLTGGTGNDEWNTTVSIGEPTVSILSNNNVVFNNQGITWKYIGQDVMQLCKTAQTILSAARSEEDINNFNNSELGRLFKDVIPYNRALNLTKEQLAYIFLIDPDGVRDYLYINYDRDLVNNVYRILTDKEPIYYEHTLLNGWIETSRIDSSFLSGVKTDGDVLLVRGDGMPDDFN